MKIIRAGSNKGWVENKHIVMLNLLDNCNFRCSYCINKQQQSRVLSKENLEVLISGLAELKRDAFVFPLAGGEPTIYPHLEKLIEGIDKKINCKSKRIIFSTNGSLLGTSRIKNLCKQASSVDVEFAVSAHLEQISVDKLVKQIELFPFKEKCRVKFLVTPGGLGEIKQAKFEFAKMGVKTQAIFAVPPKGETYKFTEEEKSYAEKIDTNGNLPFFNEYTDNGKIEQIRFSRGGKYFNPELLNYKGLNCAVGHNLIRVSPDGKVIRCFGNPQFTYLTQDNSAELREMLNSTTVCPATKCGCNPMLSVPKWAHGVKQPIYLEK